MSLESRSVVVEVGKMGKHPNADTLEITHVNGNYPCIVKSGGLKPGDKAVYIPVDSIVPDLPAFSFLEEHKRIKARRLRGIFSMGLLIPVSDLNIDAEVGTDVTDALGIIKYEAPLNTQYWQQGDAAKDPGIAPVFDVEGLRMFPTAFVGKKVHITEKIHGTNFRAVYHDGELHVGSHRTWLKKGPNLWWNVAQNYGLEDKLREVQDFVFYGEIYGPKVQDLTYGAKTPQLIFYDVLETWGVLEGDQPDFLLPNEAQYVVESLDLQYVPVLYEGWWDEKCLIFAEGNSPLATSYGIEQIREGMVIRPTVELFSDELGGRLILKQCGEQYYLRKEK